MVRWASRQIEAGRVPLDGWYPYHALGSSHFHHYQSLPHVLTAYVGRLFGAEPTYRWSNYLLLALWPIAVYASARLFEFTSYQAGAAAIIAPLVVSAPGYGFEHGSYTWQGYGIWAQLWAMWWLPLAWALTWRAVTRRGSYVPAVIAVALTIACHFMLGYLALLPIGLWVLLKGGERLLRARRAIVLAGGALIAAGWVLVPLIADRNFSARSIFYNLTSFSDSFGARKVLTWLVTGRLFDNGRLPVLTLLVAAGVVVCIARWRHDERFRAVLAVGGLSLLLFFGRPTLGPLLRLLPGSQDLQLHRFITGVHMTGILLAGLGAAAVAREVYARSKDLLPSLTTSVRALAVTGLGILVLAPAWSERVSYDSREGLQVAVQRGVDATDGAQVAALIEEAKTRGGGRIYAGMRSNWGQNYKIGEVPVYAVVANQDADQVGFNFRTVSSLSTDVEASFDETKRSQYELLNVRYLLLPAGRQPSVQATLLRRSGRHTLWTFRTSGYAQVVDTLAPIEANRSNLIVQTDAFMKSSLASQKRYPTIAFAGREAAPATIELSARDKRGPGRVEQQLVGLDDGTVATRVVANHTAMVVLKATFDPRWRVVVDGESLPPQMVAPSFVGRVIPPGRHTVLFVYSPYRGYPLLILLGMTTVIALFLWDRRRKPSADQPEKTGQPIRTEASYQGAAFGA